MKAYNAMQGQSSPLAQVVSITNTGEGKLYWNMDLVNVLQYEHLENRPWANRSISRVLAEINGNNLTDQATRSRQKSAHPE